MYACIISTCCVFFRVRTRVQEDSPTVCVHACVISTCRAFLPVRTAAREDSPAAPAAPRAASRSPPPRGTRGPRPAAPTLRDSETSAGRVGERGRGGSVKGRLSRPVPRRSKRNPTLKCFHIRTKNASVDTRLRVVEVFNHRTRKTILSFAWDPCHPGAPAATFHQGAAPASYLWRRAQRRLPRRRPPRRP